jgi:hypothetical protein
MFSPVWPVAILQVVALLKIKKIPQQGYMQLKSVSIKRLLSASVGIWKKSFWNRKRVELKHGGSKTDLKVFEINEL